MANIYNALTDMDLTKIENYIDLYGIERDGYCGNRTYLRNWATEKSDLYSLLGGTLIKEIPYDYKKDIGYIEDEMREFLYNKHNFNSFLKKLDRLVEQTEYESSVQYFFESAYDLARNTLSVYRSMNYKREGAAAPLKISNGMRYMKALAKVIDYFELGEEIKEEFEHFRLIHSQILNGSNIKGTLCLSIHPLDFMTMSDNANDWSSCMSWKSKGCYRAGTVEMMNSAYVLVAYLKTNREFHFGKDGEYTWNSKTFRQLFYISKDFIIAGKSYPYKATDITEDILRTIKNLAEENLGWSYDAKGEYCWEDSKVKITMGIMYNDLLNDMYREYPMYYVEKAFDERDEVYISGSFICLHCGKEDNSYYNHDGIDVFEDYIEDIEEYFNDRPDHSSELVCPDCLEKMSCKNCGRVHSHLYEVDGKRICAECWDSIVREDPVSGKPFIPDYYWMLREANNYRPNAFYISSEVAGKIEGFDYDATVSVEENGACGRAIPLVLSSETINNLKEQGKLTLVKARVQRGELYDYSASMLVPTEKFDIPVEKCFMCNLVVPERR